MPNVAADLLKEAFIDPIRFALLIDDQFPIYTKIAEAAPAIAQESARAAKLFSFCRGRGWLCDVDNASQAENEIERVGHLSQSDLLVLDFHLDPLRTEDPTLSLQILQKLARSGHFNLVIVYTAATPFEVVRSIAFSLGAGQEIANRADTTAMLEDCDPDATELLTKNLNSTVIDGYLAGKIQGPSAQAMRNVLKHASPRTMALHTDAIALTCEQHMSSQLSEITVTNRTRDLKVHGSFEKNSDVPWVMSGNVFVVVVSKDEEPAVLIDRLIAGLIAWNPSVLQVMMVQARAELERMGQLSDHLVLDTPTKQAGWFLRILLGVSPTERRERIHELYERLFARLIKNVSPSVVRFASKLIEPVDNKDHASRAKQMASDALHLDDATVYHALNEHLCSESFTDGVITTGVVFRAATEPEKYWLCTSPACDLVPGQNQSGWDGELHPLRQITTARLTVIRNLDSIGKQLTTATQGRHLFLSVGGKAMALEVVDPDSRQMRLEFMLLEEEGYVVNAKFSGHILKLNQNKAPEIGSMKFEVVALLRPDYANRLLAAVGQQRSRIGVDFVNQPIPNR